MNSIPVKAVIEKTVLQGSHDDRFAQLVATVYMRNEEYRVMAPAKATGDALGWFDHFVVRRMSWEGYTEVNAHEVYGRLALETVRDELQKRQRDANRPLGMNPDGLYYDAHICLAGHLKSTSGDTFNGKYCDKCGSAVISDCPHCKTPIRGEQFHSNILGYTRPSFCHNCSRPYPWMEERLKTARELLDNDDHLTLDERNDLWDLLKYVMSSPKSDLAKAKRKLIDIKLGNVAEFTKETVLDLLAKYGAEMSK